MASFLTSPQLPVSEYIPAVDPSSYATVIGQKQALYNQNTAKIQASVDSIAGVQVIKDAHKAYLSSAVESMQSDINKLAGEDFSKQSVVNQALGLASKVARDPVIQNAQLSTQQYQKAMQQREAYIKEGKTSVENDTFFNKQLNAWLSDGDVSSTFNASYIPYVDIQGEFLKIYKELNPNSTLTQEQFAIDGGNIVLMKEVATEGIDTAQINNAWNLLKQRGDIKTQLGINADYLYGSFDKDTLVSIAAQSYRESLIENDEKIQELKTKLATDKTANAVQINQEIEQLTKQGEAIAGNISYIENMNETGLRTSIYEQQLGNSFASTFRNKKQSEKIMASPYQTARKDQLDYELKLQQFEETKRKNARGGGTAGEIPSQVMKRPVSEEQGKLGESTFMRGLESTKAELQNQSRKHIISISQSMGIASPWRLSPGGEYIPNVGPGAYPSKEEAQRASDYIYGYSKVLYDTGKSNQVVNAMFNEVSGLVDQVQAMEATATNIQKLYNVPSQLYDRSLGDIVLKSAPLTSDGKFTEGKNPATFRDVTLTNKDITDWYIYSETSGDAKDKAAKALEDRFGPWFNKFLSVAFRNNKEQYSQAKSTLDSIGYAPNYEQAEQAFKDAQRTFISMQETFVPVDEKQDKLIKGSYKGVLRQLTSSERGEDYLKFINAIDDEDKKVDLGYYYNRLDNQVYLTAAIEGEEDVLEVPINASDAVNIPGIKLSSDFERRYGARLALGSGNTTDPTGQGINPFTVPGAPNRDYTVKYHLFGPGDNTFMMKLYVWDKQGNQILNGAPYSPSTVSGYMTQDQILATVQQLQNDKFVEGIRLSLENTPTQNQ